MSNVIVESSSTVPVGLACLELGIGGLGSADFAGE